MNNVILSIPVLMLIQCINKIIKIQLLFVSHNLNNIILILDKVLTHTYLLITI